MDKLSFILQGFEGPLDLLLHLIAKHKLCITDIRISELLDQYMEYIYSIEDDTMDITSEFLEMAARLVHIKTLSLLPRTEEAERLREELSGELLAYSTCRMLASKLAQRAAGVHRFVREPANLPADLTYRRQHSPTILVEALQLIQGRTVRAALAQQEPEKVLVAKKVISVSSRIVYVLRRLWKEKRTRYHELFDHSRNRSEIVATFLALLELMRARRVTVSGEGLGAEIVIQKEEPSHGT